MFKHLKGMLTSSSSINACDSSIYLLGVVLLLFICIFHVISTPHQRSSTVSRLIQQQLEEHHQLKLCRPRTSMAFAEVGYSVVLKGGITTAKEKGVLHGIRGSARPGVLLAMMGPSGSGKTTLLSLLGGRLTGNIIQGSVTYNDEPYDKSFKCRIGFVTQDDVLFTHLTVKETLTYAALLRLPRTMTRQQKEERALSAICWGWRSKKKIEYYNTSKKNPFDSRKLM
ncbi:unnamed protein product [Musa acuminata subsp. malaccensis]|uniref:(wild Malaysian banana) hypothetical protein n=1 Tax=Musa acuminata subsp. malaccensis TaxID=214687 RepID=A0A804HWH5_MUSAM|nr:unnamed protein product [Musa acuminata subsp. malaccensis]